MLLQAIAGNLGPSADGAPNELRLGRLNDLIVSELHGRYYEQAYRGNLYSGGMGLTSISNATFTSATTGATATPIAGVWNPPSSGVNLVILRAYLGITVTNATNTGTGPFVWMSSVGNLAISTGNTPFSRKTLTAGGSVTKDMSGVALTGLTNAIAVRNASGLNGGSGAGFSFVGTAVGQVTFASGINEENLEGCFIVPPGGVLGLFGTTTGVAHSAVSGILWEEVPVN